MIEWLSHEQTQPSKEEIHATRKRLTKYERNK